jgi:hypothetical protein
VSRNGASSEESNYAVPLQSVGEAYRVHRLVGKNLAEKVKILVELQGTADIL